MFDGVFDKAVERHLPSGGGHSGLPVQFRRDADVEAALIGFFRLALLGGTAVQVVVYGAVKIINQLAGILPLIGNQRADA